MTDCLPYLSCGVRLLGVGCGATSARRWIATMPCRLHAWALSWLMLSLPAAACSSKGSAPESPETLSCADSVVVYCGPGCSSFAELRSRAQNTNPGCCAATNCGVGVDRCGTYLVARAYYTDGHTTFYFDQITQAIVAVVETSVATGGESVCRGGPQTFLPPACGDLDPCLHLVDASAGDASTE